MHLSAEPLPSPYPGAHTHAPSASDVPAPKIGPTFGIAEEKLCQFGADPSDTDQTTCQLGSDSDSTYTDQTTTPRDDVSALTDILPGFAWSLPGQRFTGRVKSYHRGRGYGFILLDQKGVVEEDAIFAFWKSIRTCDRFPSLSKDMEVEFSIIVETNPAGPARASALNRCLAAHNITLPGGEYICAQSLMDEKKVIIGGKDQRYSGILKFFCPSRGYGYISVDDGQSFGAEDVPKDLRVERAEMNAGGLNPGHMRSIAVEVGILKTSWGGFKGYNVTLPGGKSFPTSL